MPDFTSYAPAAPLPCTPDALAAGCTCPARPVEYVGGYPRWWISVGCPVHDPRPAQLAPDGCQECGRPRQDMHEGICAECWAGRAYLAAQEGLG